MKSGGTAGLATGFAGLPVIEDFDISSACTWGVGGKADILIQPENRNQLEKALLILEEKETPWMVLGSGSNVLFPDSGFRGAVIRLGGAFNSLTRDREELTAGGALPLRRLSAGAAEWSLKGMEFSEGIPGTVGAAVKCNAGAFGSDIASVLKEISVVAPGGSSTISASSIAFNYRSSSIEDSRIVVSATFALKSGEAAGIKGLMEGYAVKRKASQPTGRTAGSVYKNPPGGFAAALIEQAGLKGFKLGGAMVSDRHANFIVNTGDATASDIRRLIDKVAQEVRDHSGVVLEPEVRLIGEF